MKKLFLFICIICLCSSCDNSCKENVNRFVEDTKNSIKETQENRKQTNDTWGTIVEFEYKGHEYITFTGGYQAGVVHNPDCKKCNNK